MNNSPIPAEDAALGSAFSGDSGPTGINQPVKHWPRSAVVAKSELDATLSRLAERVQYVTGATGAAIGLLEGSEMVCRATSGTTAPDLGVHLETFKGLSGECVRTGETLRCDNVELDSRVDVASCRRMGVQSIIVTPVRRNNVVVGIFELFASQPYAFQERDAATLQRTAELVKKELEKRPLVVDASYARLPEMSLPPDLFQDAREHLHEPSVNEPPHSETRPATASDVAEENPAPVATSACRNCGAAIFGGRLLCSECGSLQADPDDLAFTPAETEPAPEVLPQPEEKVQPDFRQRIHIPKYSVGAILAMMALFVAFVPIHTNQPADAQAAAPPPVQEQASAAMPAASPALPQVTPASASSAQPVFSGPAGQNPALTSNAAPATPTQMVPPAAAAPAPAPSQQLAYAAPLPSNAPPSQPVQAPAVTAALNRAAAQVPATGPSAFPDTQAAMGAIAGTPHASPIAEQPEPPLTQAQTQYEAPPPAPTNNHQNEPWLIARISNAIDSFQQMFQPPPEPGPTPEQLGDPRVVVWVDLTTGLYYCPGASTYGKTEKGKFLTQKEAHAEYFNSAIRIGCK